MPRVCGRGGTPAGPCTCGFGNTYLAMFGRLRDVERNIQRLEAAAVLLGLERVTMPCGVAQHATSGSCDQRTVVTSGWVGLGKLPGSFGFATREAWQEEGRHTIAHTQHRLVLRLEVCRKALWSAVSLKCSRDDPGGAKQDSCARRGDTQSRREQPWPLHTAHVPPGVPELEEGTHTATLCADVCRQSLIAAQAALERAAEVLLWRMMCALGQTRHPPAATVVPGGDTVAME